MVLPVAEKVFVQMKSNGVPDLSRTRAQRPADPKKKAETYGENGIPGRWLDRLVMRKEISELADKLGSNGTTT